MADMTNPDGQRSSNWIRPIAWGGATALILLPLAAMQLAPGSGVNWTLSDFVFAATVVGGVGLAFELTVRISPSWSYRAGAAVGLAAGFFLIWSNAAVGYIGDDNPYNIVFFAIVALALLGALVARLRPKGMAIVMLAAGIAHAVAGGIGFPQDPVTGPITLAFTAMWLTSAWLFHQTAQEGPTR
jgi:hypothetical protein